MYLSVQERVPSGAQRRGRLLRVPEPAERVPDHAQDQDPLALAGQEDRPLGRDLQT